MTTTYTALGKVTHPVLVSDLIGSSKIELYGYIPSRVTTFIFIVIFGVSLRE